MATKKFSKEFMQDSILWGGGEKPGKPCLIEDNIIDHTRWSVIHKIVFRDADGTFYQTTYSVGATESQNESPWEYEPEVECTEVKKAEKIVLVWEPVA